MRRAGLLLADRSVADHAANMSTRREFLKTAAAATAATAAGAFAGNVEPISSRQSGLSGVQLRSPDQTSGAHERAYWCNMARRLSTPVLDALARGRLKATMPVEANVPSERAPFTHLEALGRTLAGVAPWLELGGDATEEGGEREKLGDLARRAIDSATNPASADFVDFTRTGQTLVDAAFLGHALLRAWNQLWVPLPSAAKANVVAALRKTRATKPPETNWVLFASMVEATLARAGVPVDEARLSHGIKRHRDWYLGDGTYGDGPEFHWDYYNAYVIQPMLVEVLEVAAARDSHWAEFQRQARQRLTRYAAIQERLIAPDGTFPVIGRSMTYRCGAFQGLAVAALRHLLPTSVRPSQARVALGSVIRRTLEARGTFDDKGWLRIGVAGHQPSLAEPYISTGSLYLCTAALLPLGLPATDPFWADTPVPITQQRIWNGTDVPTDHALGGH